MKTLGALLVLGGSYGFRTDPQRQAHAVGFGGALNQRVFGGGEADGNHSVAAVVGGYRRAAAPRLLHPSILTDYRKVWTTAI